MTRFGARTEHSGLGIASFVLSFFPGLLFVGFLMLMSYYAQQQTRESMLHDNGAAMAAGGFFLTSTIFLSELVALGLGVAGAIQRERKRSFAVLGIVCSILVYAVAYAQDVVRLL